MHYTTAENIEKIIESKVFRLSSVEQIVTKSMNRGQLNEEHIYDSYLSNVFIDLGFDIIRLIPFYRASLKPLLNSTFLLSFTGTHKSDFHWREYGANAGGVAVILSAKPFTEFSESQGFFYSRGQVRYDGYYFMRRKVSEYIQCILDGQPTTAAQAKAFLKAVAFSKYQRYHPEKEERIVIKSFDIAEAYLDIPIKPQTDILRVYTKSAELARLLKQRIDYLSNKIFVI
ncbi:hypothetical protein ID47_03980 [Candidatus Paracaedibacter acanthamoebae]|uniref:DUF2971 domain-containing protein n=1 Tax=Candidatus Odyssella acanthamoebae TaxID=91604 RepID=A0A077AZA1_9PROT|nr:hypothetical protein ID47_03980 [Candidatus Paracaedibacter acanthamoebae]